ncbi:sugar ABC transporter permease [Mycobacterium sp. MS1601]|nr:sugar ABC transporter permease [Mycobacterium sp. MS1601]
MAPESTTGRSSGLHRRLTAKILDIGLLPFLLVAMVILFAVLEPRFLAPDNLANIGRQSVYLLLITMAQMIVLLCAQLDLSVGATVALVSVVTALTMSNWSGGTLSAVVVGVAAGMGVGLLVGLINGAAVTLFNVPSFMVTLGTTSAASGAALILSDGAPVTGIPLKFSDLFGTGQWLGLPIPLIIAVIAAVGVYVLLYWTTLGRSFFAVGGNQDAARVAGIEVRKVLICAFLLCSGLTALSGVLLTARVASGEATLGTTYVLLSIAAAVLGGTSLFGGEGRLGLVILGVLFIGILSNGMNLLRVSSYVQQLVIGVVLVSAVALDRVRARR